MVFGNVVATDTIFKELLFGNFPDTGDFLTREDTHVITRGKQLLEETVDSVRTCESEKVEILKGVKNSKPGFYRFATLHSRMTFFITVPLETPCVDRSHVRPNYKRTVKRTGFNHRRFNDFCSERRKSR